MTGSRGLVGATVARALDEASHEVRRFDRRDGQDVLEAPRLRDAATSCDAILHAAALLGRPDEPPEEIVAVNVVGTWNVLSAAADADVRRVVCLSTVDALGVFKGERPPDHLPLDADHACYPRSPYAISKRLCEEACRLVSDSRGLPVICLRPPGVWSRDTYAWIEAERAKRPAFEWGPFWEYGAFVDLRDLTRACLAALACPAAGYHCVLIASSDITTSGRTSRELARLLHPGVEWRGGPEYDDDPYRSLLDIGPAERLLGWKPVHTWRAHRADPAGVPTTR